MFKSTAELKPTGNYNVPGKCDKGHVSYKKAADTSTPYKCPVCGGKVH